MKTKTIIIIVVIVGLGYLYRMAKKPNLGTPQCCDINYENYNESCFTNTDCVCDQEECKNNGDGQKINFNF